MIYKKRKTIQFGLLSFLGFEKPIFPALSQVNADQQSVFLDKFCKDNAEQQ